ncbi:major facilitator superfamily domain-containing protein [Talaromyces proteolyticus]|uniref:Major facilitator superfamily domain-containing protein n=1 Tax=Talaromyces proteolyticus TaxID=1131652 RepID=A0AAD4KNJ7_9EURO|nr:major facilitator superfamily domain-containing protein [Talaromyces proteolyticus]KAH8694295.1 major facilitator superfamily domain-containing protein [Talaromyces proteolyticus]
MAQTKAKLASTEQPAGLDQPRPSLSLPAWRKNLILFSVSWMTLVITYSSTALLPALPEISNELSTTQESIAITNAGVFLAMGFSSFIWIPVGHLIGRQRAYNLAIFILCGCSCGAAVATKMAIFTTMRVLAGLTGTYFMVAGQTMLADIFEPVVRGRAVGFFMVGSVSGPAFAPCIGGILVTFTHWRYIFWVQVGMGAIGLVTSLLFIPNLDKMNSSSASGPENRLKQKESINCQFNPFRVFVLLVYPNVFLADLTCGLLAWFQYGLLTSARSIFNPRFHLTTALVSGLFYIAPGTGFLVGSVAGGRLSDRTVKRYIKRRDGLRLPQDRLNSGLFMILGVLPLSTLIYAWTLQKEIGGMAVPIISAFFAGLGLMGIFNSLNTYTAEVLPAEKTEVISSKYLVQYLFGAGTTGTIVPLINAIGVGWTFTISMIMCMFGGILTLLISRKGIDMQEWAVRKLGKD